MANKPQLTFARIVSGTVDTNGIGTGSVAITQAPVTVAVTSATAITIATTVSNTTATTTATASSPITDVSTTAMESGNHTSSTTPGGSCVIASAVPYSSGKNKDGLHQRFVEERKPDSNGNAHVQRSILSGPHQQNHYHQQIQRRNKPRLKNDRSRKDDNVLSVGKEENETHTEQQPEVILGPAPLPTVNAWFKHSVTETKESKEESEVLKPHISSAKEEVNSLPLKKMDTEKDNVIKSVAQETLTSTGENNSKKMAKSSLSSQTTKQEKQVDTEATNVDDKAWPSLNEAVNEELKPDNAINNVITKGGAVNHEVIKIIDSSEAVYYTDMKQDRDKENESNGNGGKNNKSGKAWKKLDIDVDYTGREGQGRRGNTGPGNKSDHPQKNSRRGSSFAKQQAIKQYSPSYGVITVPASTTENVAKIVPALAPASLLGCAQPLSYIAPAFIYSPECATISDEYAEEDYW
ncbi:unnamed protein product [Onchocerca flexuosa]|uniref:La-related protein 1 n=1 Tax=Onchocerca flexuosa TaxID=387005 RepID=A0A183H0L6_9BILA|nr:unnamed protein product [Onchocerca flexuosa]